MKLFYYFKPPSWRSLLFFYFLLVWNCFSPILDIYYMHMLLNKCPGPPSLSSRLSLDTLSAITSLKWSYLDAWWAYNKRNLSSLQYWSYRSILNNQQPPSDVDSYRFQPTAGCQGDPSTWRHSWRHQRAAPWQRRPVKIWNSSLQGCIAVEEVQLLLFVL